MDLIKTFFGGEETEVDHRRVFCELTSELEMHATCGGHPTTHVVDTAKRMRDVLADRKLALSSDEKIKLVKLMNKAKVKALLMHDNSGYEIFQSLDSISSDVTRLL